MLTWRLLIAFVLQFVIVVSCWAYNEACTFCEHTLSNLNITNKQMEQKSNQQSSVLILLLPSTSADGIPAGATRNYLHRRRCLSVSRIKLKYWVAWWCNESCPREAVFTDWYTILIAFMKWYGWNEQMFDHRCWCSGDDRLRWLNQPKRA